MGPVAASQLSPNPGAIVSVSYTVVAVMLAHNPDPITFGRVMAAVEAQTVVPSTLVIVDNGSEPAITAPPQWIKLRLDRNLGVGAGHNLGWRHAIDSVSPDFLWALEHDSIPDHDCLEHLVD